MTRYLTGANLTLIICAFVIFLTSNHALAQSIYKGGSGDGFAVGTVVQPDDPQYDIYKGGNGDGFSVSTFVQPDNPQYDLYKGGSGDGSTVSCFTQPDDPQYDLYKGGNGDGFAVTCFIQPDDPQYDIYKGGIGDGFVVNCFIQPDDIQYDIYKGGSGDGFSVMCFVQPNSILYDIYKGGNGDGYSLFCVGSIGNEVGLPIQLLNFNAKYSDNVVYLQWRTASELNNDYFTIERSVNGINFVEIYTVPGAGTTTIAKTYSFTDEGPVPGMNYYRLKQVDFDGHFTYSSIISITAESKGPSMTIFPNPSDNSSTVNVRMNGVGEGTPVELTITSIYGQVMTTYETTLDSNQQIKLPNSISNSLASGVYVVSVRFSVGHVTTKWVVK